MTRRGENASELQQAAKFCTARLPHMLQDADTEDRVKCSRRERQRAGIAFADERQAAALLGT